MGKSKVSKNFNNFNCYEESHWKNFLKKAAYRGFNINKVAKQLGKKGTSCTYDRKNHQLKVTSKKGKQILIDMVQVSGNNDRWTFSRLIHKITTFFSKSFNRKFHSRIENLAQAILKDNFSIKIGQLIKKSDLSLNDIKSFFGLHKRAICSSIGDQAAYDQLMLLSQRVSNDFDTPESRALAFEIQGTAQGLIPNKNVNWSSLPKEVQQVIFANLPQNADSLNPLLSVSKEVKENAMPFINEGISDQIIPAFYLSSSKEAIAYIQKHQIKSVFNLAPFYYLNDEDLKELQKCTHIKHLSIETKNISTTKLAETLNKLPNLESLEISGLDNFGISENEFSNIIKGMSKLKKLSFFSCNGLTGLTLAPALATLPHLEDLSFSCCISLKEDLFVDTLGQLPQLKSLKVNRCPSILSALVKWVEKVPQLETLHVRDWRDISFSQIAKVIEKLPHLKSLNLTEHRLSDEFIKTCKHLKELETLSIRGCRGVPDDTFIQALSELTQLKTLDISDTHLVGDKLVQVVQALPELQTLTVSSLSQIAPNNSPVQTIKSLPQLHTLILVKPRTLTKQELLEFRKKIGYRIEVLCRTKD